jgi:hypothetical protein
MSQFAETGHGNERIIGSRSWESTPIFSFLCEDKASRLDTTRAF